MLGWILSELEAKLKKVCTIGSENELKIAILICSTISLK